MFGEKKSTESNLTLREAHPLEQVRRQFDRMWDSWVAPFGLDFGRSERWDFDVTENDKGIVVRAEMPGFDEKELDVRLNNDLLTISAQKERKDAEQEQSQRYFRSVTLPHGIDEAKVQATYRNGVLELRLPRPEAARGARIPIQGPSANEPTVKQIGTADKK